MNDAAVHDLWKALKRLGDRVIDLERRMNEVDARIRARLKEEAENRKNIGRLASGYEIPKKDRGF